MARVKNSWHVYIEAVCNHSECIRLNSSLLHCVKSVRQWQRSQGSQPPSRLLDPGIAYHWIVFDEIHLQFQPPNNISGIIVHFAQIWVIRPAASVKKGHGVFFAFCQYKKIVTAQKMQRLHGGIFCSLKNTWVMRFTLVVCVWETNWFCAVKLRLDIEATSAWLKSLQCGHGT